MAMQDSWFYWWSRLFAVPTIREGEVNEMDLESFFLHAVHQIEIVVLVHYERHEPQEQQYWKIGQEYIGLCTLRQSHVCVRDKANSERTWIIATIEPIIHK